jgi:predicted transcriptional regulator of viral defense system
MKPDIEKRIIEMANKENGFIRTRDVLAARIHNTYLKKLLDAGKLEQVKRGLYRLTDIPMSTHDTLIQAAMSVPHGVVGMLSALAYYNLTTITPWEVSVVIEQGKKAFLPAYPPIKIYHFASAIFLAGITIVKVDGHSLRIYKKEKALCDCIRYRNQLGMDVVRECLRTYLKNSNRDLDMLIKYAKVCKVEKLLKNYLEVLL